jgi:hypothetical protein
MDEPSPYKGLVPYTEDDAEWFFGRDDERELIVANLLSSRLTLLYGTSGAGKSSVIRAGVVHQFRRELARGRARGEPPECAVVVFKEWSTNPSGGLLAEAERAVRLTLGREPRVKGVTLHGSFSAWTEELDAPLLVILDQFEEYFLYHPEATPFERELARLVNDEALRVNVLLSIREDRVSSLDRFKGTIPRLFANYLRVRPLDRAAARAAIERPIEHFRELHPERKVSIDPALVDAVLSSVTRGMVVLDDVGRGVARSAPAERVEPPYLQLVMTRLWQEAQHTDGHLSTATLERIGGAEKIVRTHLDGVMQQIPRGDWDVAAEMFHYLVTPAGSKIAHAASDLAALSGVDSAVVARVLAVLSSGKNRILRTVDAPEDGSTQLKYEIFHDVLARAVLDWRRRYVSGKEAQEAIETAGRDLRAKTRRRLRLVLTAVLCVLAGLAGGYALYERNVRLAAEQELDASKRNYEASTKRLQALEAQAKALDTAGQRAEEVHSNTEKALLTQLETTKTELNARSKLSDEQRQQLERVTELSEKLASARSTALAAKKQAEDAATQLDVARVQTVNAAAAVRINQQSVQSHASKL